MRDCRRCHRAFTYLVDGVVPSIFDCLFIRIVFGFGIVDAGSLFLERNDCLLIEPLNNNKVELDCICTLALS